MQNDAQLAGEQVAEAVGKRSGCGKSKIETSAACSHPQ